MAATSNRFNEGKAVDAVIRRIETREGCRRGDDARSPEREGHAAPVEFVCSIGRRLFAFEHTGIEPFSGHIRMEVEGPRLFGPIVQRLAALLPSNESFELHVPFRATVGLNHSQIEPIQNILAKWVLEIAATLPIAPYGRYVTPIKKVALPGVPFLVSLHRIAEPRPLRGRFTVVHLVGDNLEAARLDRIREACERKFPKLAEWKRSHGARTVLVLEDNDIQLTNPQLVANAVFHAEKIVADKPDDIYLVTTCVENPWWVTCIRCGDKSYYDFGEPDERIWEVDPGTLLSLTER